MVDPRPLLGGLLRQAPSSLWAIPAARSCSVSLHLSLPSPSMHVSIQDALLQCTLTACCQPALFHPTSVQCAQQKCQSLASFIHSFFTNIDCKAPHQIHNFKPRASCCENRHNKAQKRSCPNLPVMWGNLQAPAQDAYCRSRGLLGSVNRCKTLGFNGKKQSNTSQEVQSRMWLTYGSDKCPNVASQPMSWGLPKSLPSSDSLPPA